MSNFGIVCEFNPLHNGHARLFREARELGAERIVCVMSGNAVQRGELAIFDKYKRAEAALRCGADLVIELPFPWCSASAEYFSRASVSLLSHFCTDIIFGSECGEIELLQNAAKSANCEEFRNEFRRRTDGGERAAEVYFDMLSGEGGYRFSSNDLLGIEYMRAIESLGLDMRAHTVKREGADYNDTELGASSCPSATALRAVWQDGSFEKGEKYMPREAYDIFEKAYFDGEMTDVYQLSRAILMYFRLRSADSFDGIADAQGGIANRICALAGESESIEELFEKLSTKRYTDAKLRRAMLFCLCSVKEELLGTLPEYTNLLAANKKGREILSSVRKNSAINVVTKPADAPTDSEQYKAQQRLDAIFTLAKMQPSDSAEYLKKTAYIE